MLVAVFSMAILAVGAFDGFEIHNTKEPSVFVEDMGDVRLLADRWNVMVPISIEKFRKELEYVVQLRDQFISRCTNADVSDFCHRIVLGMTPTVEHLRQNFETINHYFEKPRSRRGIANFGGRIANALFGVMDDQDAARLEDQLHAMESNLELNRQVVSNQTVIMKTTIHSLEDFASNTVTQLHKLRINFKLINESIGKLESELIENKLNAVIEEFLMVTVNIERRQEQLLQVFIFAKSNRVHPILFSDKEYSLLKKTITLEPGFFLPDDYSSFGSIQLLRVNKYKIIFEITLPIFNARDSFRIVHLTPLPAKTQRKTFNMFMISNPYIIINSINENYILMNDIEFDKQCHKVDNSYLCNTDKPLFNTINYKTCELQLLLELDQGNCSVADLIIVENMFTLMHDGHNVLFAVTNPWDVNIRCNDSTERIHFDGSGVINFKHNCEIRTESFVQKIFVEPKGLSKATLYKFEWKIVTANTGTKTQKKTTLLELPEIRDLKNMKEIKSQLDYLGNTKYMNTNKNLLSKHDIILYVLILLGFLVILTITIRKNYVQRKFKVNRETTVEQNVEEKLEIVQLQNISVTV